MACSREHRVYKRADCGTNASYKVLGEYISNVTLGYKGATAKNISKGGACIVMPVPVEKGDVLLLDVAVEGLTNPINTICEVMWCRKTDSGYEAGLSFITIKQKDSEVIEKYADHGLN
jgi:hypothetical protein